MNTASAPTATHATRTLDEQPWSSCRVTVKQRFLTMASNTHNLHTPYVIIRKVRARMLTERQRRVQNAGCLDAPRLSG